MRKVRNAHSFPSAFKIIISDKVLMQVKNNNLKNIIKTSAGLSFLSVYTDVKLILCFGEISHS